MSVFTFQLFILTFISHIIYATQNQTNVLLPTECIKVIFERRPDVRYVGKPAFGVETTHSTNNCGLHCSNTPACKSANFDRIGSLCLLFDSVPTQVPLSPTSRMYADFETQLSPAVAMTPRHIPRGTRSGWSWDDKRRRRRRQAMLDWTQIWTNKNTRPVRTVSIDRAGGRMPDENAEPSPFEHNIGMVYIWMIECRDWTTLPMAPTTVTPILMSSGTTDAEVDSVSSTITTNETTTTAVPTTRNCSQEHIRYQIASGHSTDEILEVSVVDSMKKCAIECYRNVLCTAVNYKLASGACEQRSSYARLSSYNQIEESMKTGRFPVNMVQHEESVGEVYVLTGVSCIHDQLDLSVVSPQILSALRDQVSWLGNSHRTSVAYSQSTVPAPVSQMCGRPELMPSVAQMTEDAIQFGVPRIVGGSEARPHSWPWQVGIYYHGKHICGGSLVSSQAVVTAAHCVQEDVIVHPRYHRPRTHMNDIAILILQQEVKFSATLMPICLAQRDVQPGTQCVATGWDTGDSNALRQVVLPIIANEVCNDRRHYAGRVDSRTMICAGSQGRDSCQGDSGGPLVCPSEDGSGASWDLHGIVSWGVGCAQQYKPGIYTRISSMRHWIIRSIDQSTNPSDITDIGSSFAIDGERNMKPMAPVSSSFDTSELRWLLTTR